MKTATSTSAKTSAKKTVAVKTATKKTVAPVADKKMAAANDVAEVTPKTLIADAVAVLTASEKKEALNLAEINRPALTDEAKVELDKKVAEIKAAAPVKEKKIKLTLPKLRRVGDILNALKAGAFIVREEGLYRLSLKDGQRQPVSKRRCINFINKGVVKTVATGMSRGFINAWELAPVEKTPEAPKQEKK